MENGSAECSWTQGAHKHDQVRAIGPAIHASNKDGTLVNCFHDTGFTQRRLRIQAMLGR